MGVGRDHAVKVLSPEILSLRECAEALCTLKATPAPRERRVSRGRPGSKSGSRDDLHDGNQGDPWFSSAREYAVRAEEARTADGAMEVGSPHSTDETR